jgi:hypothetical protein
LLVIKAYTPGQYEVENAAYLTHS